MKVNLITGADGTGKSTMLNRLAEEDVPVLRIPNLDEEVYGHDPDLLAVVRFVHATGVMGDKQGIPGLKILSMFTSMVFFREFSEVFEGEGEELIFTERHPMVDTFVYGKVYHRAMSPGLLPIEIDEQIREAHPRAFFLLNRRLAITGLTFHALRDVLAYLNSLFGHPLKDQIRELAPVFGVDAPGMIYYLHADVEVLLERMSERSQLELHESENALKEITNMYERLFEITELSIQKVDMSTWKEADELYRKLMTEIKKGK